MIHPIQKRELCINIDHKHVYKTDFYFASKISNMATMRIFDFSSDRLCTQVIIFSQKLSKQQTRYKATNVYNRKICFIRSAGLRRAVLSYIERYLRICSISVNCESITNSGPNLWAEEEGVSTRTNTECYISL